MAVSSLPDQQHSPGDITDFNARFTWRPQSLGHNNKVYLSPPISHFRGVSLTGDLISLDRSGNNIYLWSDIGQDKVFYPKYKSNSEQGF